MLLSVGLVMASALVPQVSLRAPMTVRSATRTAAFPRMTAEPPPGSKLDDFLVLLTRCYAGAGAAHGIDFATANALPAAAGLAPFAELPPAGRALGVIWVVLGLVQPLASDRDTQQAAVVAYGVYEIILTLAAQGATAEPEGLPARLGAAVGVQLVVAYCYVELRRQSVEAAAAETPSARRTSTPRMMAGHSPPQPKQGGKSKGGTGQDGSFQQKLEQTFGPDFFKALVIVTGVLCYPLMAYGIAQKAAERAAGL